MSMAIGHFAVGFTATVTLLLALGLHGRVNRLGRLWAMLPDVGALLPGNPALDHDPVVNLFWFHYFLDTHPFTDGLAGSVLFVALMCATVVLVFALDTAKWASGRAGRRAVGEGGGHEE
jgi:hypothetical protein